MIRDPRPRSARWLSTSIPEAQWQGSLARTLSAEYNVNNLVSPVLFQEALLHVPEHAVVLEIAPHALLQVCAWGRVCGLREGRGSRGSERDRGSAPGLSLVGTGSVGGWMPVKDPGWTVLCRLC